MRKLILAAALTCVSVLAQSNVLNGVTIRDNTPADFSNGSRTRPCRIGSGTPSAIAGSIGDCYFQQDATAGSNFWFATTAGTPATWSQLISSGLTVPQPGITDEGGVDFTIVPMYSSGSGAPSAACEPGRDYYVDYTATKLYFCSATDTWKEAGSSGISTRTVEYAVAKCFAGTAATPLNMPTSGAPTAACDATDGKPTLTFAATNTTGTESFILPATLTSITAKVAFRANASATNVSGNAAFRISYACQALGTTTVPSLSTTANGTGTITAAPGNNSYEASMSLNITSCAGKRLYWALSLVSRTLAADPQVIDTLTWTVLP